MSEAPPGGCTNSSKALKRRFTGPEDEALLRLVSAIGSGKWDEIAQYIPERTPRQCRERYENYLMEHIPKPPWTSTDDEQLLKEIEVHGHHWTAIALCFPGRNTNDLKNRWHKVLSKRETGQVSTARIGARTLPDSPFEPMASSSEPDWPVAEGSGSDWTIEERFLL
jgi:hypothetical protein